MANPVPLTAAPQGAAAPRQAEPQPAEAACLLVGRQLVAVACPPAAPPPAPWAGPQNRGPAPRQRRDLWVTWSGSWIDAGLGSGLILDMSMAEGLFVRWTGPS